MKAYDTVKKILDEIDMKLSCESADPPIKFAGFSFYYVKILFDVIHTNIQLLTEIIAQERPEKIVTFTSNSFSSQGISPFANDEPVFAQLLTLDGWNTPVICISSQESAFNNPPPHPVHGKILRQFFLQSPTLFNMAMIAKRKGIRYLVPVLLSTLIYKKKSVVIYGSGYNWDDALVELYCAGLHPVLRYLSPCGPERDLGAGRELQKSILTICRESDFISSHGVIYGIDARALLFKKLSIMLACAIAESRFNYLRASEFLHEWNPRCLLLSTQAYPADRAVIQAAHDHGIKVVSWQHGGGGTSFHPMMPFAEFIDSDVHLVFGNAVKTNYIMNSRSVGIMVPPDFIPVGSSSLDYIARSMGPLPQHNRPLSILYITTFYLNKSYYISSRSSVSTYNEMLWSLQKKMFEVAKKNSKLAFIFKLHPLQEKDFHISHYAADEGIRNVTIIISEKTISQLLEDADVIVFDIISTGLLQVLHTKKPVFILSTLGKMDTVSIELLKKRAFVFDNIDALIQGIEEYLKTAASEFAEQWGVDYANTEFLREYGTYKNDGKSAVRAVQFVKEVVTTDSHSR